ncbi:MAG TPA: CDGSH iron-sulfur domain-containing protein [Rhodothermales bacterium]|nr:CDGSH iron-sulfur domain-containing protein [Rhodothermales bacterium]
MAEKTYPGDGIQVRYGPRRCIHFAACVRGLPGVFDPDRRPWIVPAGADADAVARVVTRCPTGALHYERTDGGPGETTPAVNTVRVAMDGPLYVRGDVTVETPEGFVVLEDTRVALCRCGRSSRKPFCDNSHRSTDDSEGFIDAGSLGTCTPKEAEGEGTALRVELRPNGPLLFRGPITITGADGNQVTTAKVSLCRCGASANKPFCDGSHRNVGFEAPTPEAAPVPPA